MAQSGRETGAILTPGERQMQCSPPHRAGRRLAGHSVDGPAPVGSVLPTVKDRDQQDRPSSRVRGAALGGEEPRPEAFLGLATKDRVGAGAHGHRTHHRPLLSAAWRIAALELERRPQRLSGGRSGTRPHAVPAVLITDSRPQPIDPANHASADSASRRGGAKAMLSIRYGMSATTSALMRSPAWWAPSASVYSFR